MQMTIECHELIKVLNDTIERNYVFPDVAFKITEYLRRKLNGGAYDCYDEHSTLASVITNDIYEACRDHHLRVKYSPGTLSKPEDDSMTFTHEILEKMSQEFALENFGFNRVERLRGNIGFIQLRYFAPAEIGGETATAAMNFISHTTSLILDLRDNHGGVPSMVDLLCGYFFRPSVHLDSLYWAKQNSIEQHWSLPYVAGKHYGTKPVYVLVSDSTFSAAEELAYTLQQYHRATLIGEKTPGGANPGRGFQITSDFEVFVPMGQAVHPITKSNWEGIGVNPDINVPAGEAFDHAYQMALKHALSSVTSVSARADVEAALEQTRG